MRDFNVTAEPRGGEVNPRTEERGNRCHLWFRSMPRAASLRLQAWLAWRSQELGCAPRARATYPGDKRLAVEVEDHPMEYGGFEGTIPKGQYGGGTVMVWDFGDWQPLGDADRQLEKGDLKFILNGTKLKGNWVLVRMRRRDTRSFRQAELAADQRERRIHPAGRRAGHYGLAPDSALTQRTMEQIAESNDHVWDSKRGPAGTEARLAQRERKLKQHEQLPHKSAPRSSGCCDPRRRRIFPASLRRNLQMTHDRRRMARNWVHELKLDGYRIQVHVRSGSRQRQSSESSFVYAQRAGLDGAHAGIGGSCGRTGSRERDPGWRARGARRIGTQQLFRFAGGFSKRKSSRDGLLRV